MGGQSLYIKTERTNSVSSKLNLGFDLLVNGYLKSFPTVIKFSLQAKHNNLSFRFIYNKYMLSGEEKWQQKIISI